MKASAQKVKEKERSLFLVRRLNNVFLSFQENKKTFQTQTTTHKVTYSRFVGFHTTKMKKIALFILVAVFVMAGLVVETDCFCQGFKAKRMQFKEKVGL